MYQVIPESYEYGGDCPHCGHWIYGYRCGFCGCIPVDAGQFVTTEREASELARRAAPAKVYEGEALRTSFYADGSECRILTKHP